MKQQYRITGWRFDTPEYTHSTPEFEGATIEACDERALRHFDSVSDQPQNQWEGLAIVRIDMPAVAEKATLLKTNGRQGG